MKVLVFGSLNIDHVYRVPHLLRAGETLSSAAYQRNAGGKGLNQAIALARAGQRVSFAGCIGQDGIFLRDALAEEGVDVSPVWVTDTPTGHAVIQLDDRGSNAILLYGGANQCVSAEMMDKSLDGCERGDLVLMQNEISLMPEIIPAARKRGLQIALNPSPAVPAMRSWPLELVDWLLLNEVEGQDLTGASEPDEMLEKLLQRCPNCHVVLTLGADGAIYGDAYQRLRQEAIPVKAVDTTAAGDTFTGYFLHTVLSGGTPAQALSRAARAAAIAVGRPGASASIPRANEVE